MSKIYKYTAGICIALTALVGATSCDNNDFNYYVSKYQVSPDQTTLTIGGDIGNTTTFSVTADTEWKIDIPSDVSWLTASPTQGGSGTTTVTLTNGTLADASNSGVFYLVMNENTNIRQAITVNRSKGTSEFGFNGDSSYTIDYQGGTFSFSFNCPLDDWSIELNYPDKDNEGWLSLDKMEGSKSATITGTVDENEGAERKCYIIITNARTENTITFTLTQTSPSVYFTVTPTEFTDIPAAGETRTLTIASSSPWVVEGLFDWVSLTYDGEPITKGDAGKTYTCQFEISTNVQARRENTFNVKNANDDSEYVTVKVSQSAASAYFYTNDSTEYNVTELGETIRIEILHTNDLDFEMSVAQSDRSWISASKVDNNNATITIYTNTTTSDRQGTVTVQCPNDNSRNFDITINQAAGTLPTDLTITETGVTGSSFSVAGGAESVQELTDRGFLVSTSRSALESYIAAGSGSNVDKVSVGTTGSFSADYPASSTETYYVCSYAENAVGIAFSTIIEIGTNYLYTDTADISFDAVGGEITFQVISNISWDIIDVQGDWLSAKIEGNNVVVTADPNPYNVSRNDGAIIIQGNDLSCEVAVSQAAGYAPDNVSISYDANLVTSSSITVSMSYSSYLTLSDYGFQISTDNNFDNANTVTGSLNYTFTGLDPRTTYYLRAFASSTAGTTYSSAISVTTLGSTPNEDDNNPPTP